jgi:hypothetical protein
MQKKDEVRRREKRRRRRLTNQNKSDEREARRKVRRLAKVFIDDEAEESDCEDTENEVCEDGLHSIFLDDRILDSRGKAYVQPAGNTGRLHKIVSHEFFSLLPSQKRTIVAREVRCKKVSATLL